MFSPLREGGEYTPFVQTSMKTSVQPMCLHLLMYILLYIHCPSLFSDIPIKTGKDEFNICIKTNNTLNIKFSKIISIKKIKTVIYL